MARKERLIDLDYFFWKHPSFPFLTLVVFLSVNSGCLLYCSSHCVCILEGAEENAFIFQLCSNLKWQVLYQGVWHLVPHKRNECIFTVLLKRQSVLNWSDLWHSWFYAVPLLKKSIFRVVWFTGKGRSLFCVAFWWWHGNLQYLNVLSWQSTQRWINCSSQVITWQSASCTWCLQCQGHVVLLILAVRFCFLFCLAIL